VKGGVKKARLQNHAGYLGVSKSDPSSQKRGCPSLGTEPANVGVPTTTTALAGLQ